MSGGGSKGGGGTNAVDLEIADRERQQRQYEVDLEQYNREKAAYDAQQARQAQVNLFNQNWGSAATDATNRYTQALRNRGIADPYIGDVVSRVVGDIQRGIPQDTTASGVFDPNVAGYYTDDALDNVLARMTGEVRDRNTRAVSDVFTPGMSDAAFVNTANDDIINAILGTQRSDAAAILDRARARGNLDQTGYDRGQARLGELQTAGFSEANTLADAILSGYRGELSGIEGRARDAAGSTNYGDSFDVGQYQNQWNTRRDELMGGLEGATRSALEGHQFFDIGDIITQSGIAQGAQNPNNAAAAAAARSREQRDAQRGLGGTGSF